MNGKELKELRLHLGLTQTQMAESLCISRSAIAKIEIGKTKFISKPVVRLAENLKNKD